MQAEDIWGGAERARGIPKRFGDVVAPGGVNLDVAAGQIHRAVGPDGAGKTTLSGLLLGLALADHGTLEVLGTPAGRSLAAPDGVAGLADGPGLYPPARPSTSSTSTQPGGTSPTLTGRRK